MKYLVGVAPNGAVTFLSKNFRGSTSDKVVTHLVLGISLNSALFVIKPIEPWGVLEEFLGVDVLLES